MKILFISPDIEEKARGINVILKSLMNAARERGDQAGVLVGYPHASSSKETKDDKISEKLELLNLKHYLINGRKSFEHIAPGGYKKLNILKSFFNLSIFRPKEIAIKDGELNENVPLREVDYVIKSPYFYQFLTRNITFLPRFMLKRVCKKYKIDLVIVASPSVLRSKDCGPNTKLIHFVHDLMPIELTETPPDNDTPGRYARQLRSTIKNSDMLFANSKDTRSKILEISPESKVSVLYGTPSQKKINTQTSTILETKQLSRDGYFIFASTLETRKNVENLLDAYTLAYKDVQKPLVLVGGKGYGYENIEAKYKSLPKEVRQNVIFTGYVSEVDKYALMQNAFCFVFPSIYEGLGLVILEALQNNLPVITSSVGALPEAGGNAAYYIKNPYNQDEIAKAIVTINNDEKLRKTLLKNASSVLKQFTHEKFNSRFNKAIEEMSKNG